MTVPLHLLVLEDNPSDAELIIHELRRAGFEPDWKRVETEGDFLAALDPSLDLILADYRLPQFDGLRALNLVQERKLGIPLLIVSGTIGEELAVEAMKMGAADYLLKDRLARLGPAVKQVLERKRAEEKLEDERTLLRTLIDNLPDQIYVKDEKGRKIISNKADWQASGGKTMEDVLGKTDLETYPPELAQDFWAVDKSVIDSGIPIINREDAGLDSQGKPVSLLSTKVPLRDGQGKVIGLVGIGRDISERKHREEALRKSEKEYRDLFENSLIGISQARLDGHLIRANRAYAQMYGYENPEKMMAEVASIGKQLYANPQDQEEVLCILAAKGIMESREIEVVRRDGTRFFVLVTARAMKDSTGNVLFNQAEYIDITERKQAEEKLATSENELRALFAAMTDTVLILDGEGRYLRIAPTNPVNLYHPADDLLGKTVNEVLPKEQADFMIAKIHAAIQTNQAILGEYALEIDGKEIWFASSTSKLSDNSVIWVAHDITERKRTEAKLVEHHATLNAILESSPNPVFSVDNQYRYTSFNKAHAAVMKILYEAEIDIGHSILDYQIVPEDREISHKNLDHALLGHQFIESAYSGEPGPSRRYFEVAHNPIYDPTGKVIGVSVFASDITERRQAEETLQAYSSRLAADVTERTRELHEAQDELVRKEKLAVLGTLAGGVGHELRNPLGVISNSVYYLKMVQPDANEKIKKHHAILEKELHNATRIVSDLLDYARKISTEPQPVSVSELVEYTLNFFPVPASISIKIRIPADLPQVYADPLHVKQILGNLVTNACQAMANPSLDAKAVSATMSGSCKLTISAHLRKQMVAIAVKDTGSGIAPENMEKLFEPLFSTKVTGIGLGLAVSKKLAEANGGRIEVKSQAGKGSTFTLYLPAKADK